MEKKMFDWLPPAWDWQFFRRAILAGVGFGIYVFYKGTEESSWKDIVGWGGAVYLTFLTLANLPRFIAHQDTAMNNLIIGTSRWWAFIITIVITAGLMRKFHQYVKNRKTYTNPVQPH